MELNNYKNIYYICSHLLSMLFLTVYLYKRDLSSSRLRLLFCSWPVLRKSNVVLPRWHLALKLAPYESSNFAYSTLPLRHASCRMVMPRRCSESSGNRQSGSAPSFSKKLIFLISPASAAVIRQVCPVA